MDHAAQLFKLFLIFALLTLINAIHDTPEHGLETLHNGLGNINWPESATMKMVSVKRDTNARRMQNGLAPVAPARLYGATPTLHELRPRISPAPNTAGRFTFQQCAASFFPASRPGFATATSTQDAVNQCAALVGNSYNTMGIIFRGGDRYQCYGGISSITGGGAECTASNAGIYAV
ncbi:hypothetical protein CI109_102716 [Kwoniella shandongensis]|uniref:Uncharacterized protein n=1 Tax=Kwoniella shandongensis TaxID=1734106 RepID=A0A5M6C0M0_9TREE|nr:uncharacterized protein CI109_004962 [Kwoniella shandongensis]KAA5526759.1 hypothetical protein CI109_004962 [Kwoniella shandongensis]